MGLSYPSPPPLLPPLPFRYRFSLLPCAKLSHYMGFGAGQVCSFSEAFASVFVLFFMLSVMTIVVVVTTGPPGHRKRSQVALTWAQLMCWPPSHWVMASSRVSWGVEVDIPAEGSKFPQHENYIQFPKWDM